MSLSNKILNNLREQELYEMSNISTRESGLKTKLHIIQNGKSRGLQHWIRVKVELSDKTLFPIKVNNKEVLPINTKGEFDRLDNTDKTIVNKAIEYVKKNKELIIAYWKGQFEEEDLHDILNGRITLQQAIDKNK